MRRAGDALNAVMTELGLESRLRLSKLISDWRSILNEPLCLHTMPSDLKGRTLTLVADSPAWLNEVKYFKQEIINRLAPYSIGDIIFKIGRVYRPVAAAKPSAPVCRFELDEQENAFVEHAASAVKGEELRKEIEITVKRWIIHKKESEHEIHSAS